MFLINSRQGYFRCGPSCEGQVLFRSYDHFFAEFLNEVSPVHLGALTPAYLCWFAVRTRLNFKFLWGFSREPAQ